MGFQLVGPYSKSSENLVFPPLSGDQKASVFTRVSKAGIRLSLDLLHVDRK